MGIPDIERTVGDIFGPEEAPSDSASRSSSNEVPLYSEALLHNAANANKYYTYFQRYHRQFIDDNNKSSIFQPSQSKLAALSKTKVGIWDESNHSAASAFLEHEQPLIRSLPVSSSRNTASSLFSWSSGDTYIAARRMELQNRNNSSAPSTSSSASTSPSISSKPVKRRSNLTQRLSSTVEEQSNMFIQDRINVIKAHHLEQASKKVDERRKRDHELHLRRIRLKEEAYEKALQAAIASQHTKRNSGFFGSLFGAKPVSKSFTLDLIDSEFLTFDRPSSGKSSSEILTPTFNASLNSSPVPASPLAASANGTGSNGSPIKASNQQNHDGDLENDAIAEKDKIAQEATASKESQASKDLLSL